MQIPGVASPGVRRRLRRSDQLGRCRTGVRRSGGILQEPGASRASVPVAQDDSTPSVAGVHLYGAACAGACLPVHAGVLRRMASAPAVGAATIRGRRPRGARAQRQSPVEPAQVSPGAKAKADTKQTPDGFPVHSLRTLLDDLATLSLNQVTLPNDEQHEFPLLAQPTPLQQKAFDLLEIDPGKAVSSKIAG